MQAVGNQHIDSFLGLVCGCVRVVETEARRHEFEHHWDARVGLEQVFHFPVFDICAQHLANLNAAVLNGCTGLQAADRIIEQDYVLDRILIGVFLQSALVRQDCEECSLGDLFTQRLTSRHVEGYPAGNDRR